jgi:hypothetical protein
MPSNSQNLSEKSLADLEYAHYCADRIISSKAALVERLPLTLSYAANLEPGDRAVLFYDNLVVAAEYFCAFIEAGIKEQETTCIAGLDPARYRTLFEQVGISVAELENCGYLRNVAAEQFFHNFERSNRNGSVSSVRFINIETLVDGPNNALRELIENDRRIHALSRPSTTSICCYDARLVLDDVASDGFIDLLKSHDHCFFQGLAMRSQKLLGAQRSDICLNSNRG